MARFQREAEVLASLNHPNIAAIYGIEHADGMQALAMEMVEGESPKGPLPFHEAWQIASQIADALECAHDKGVIHRDLKPANVKVTSEGVVKLLDFGLAKAFTAERPSGSGENAGTAAGENSPTLTIGATEVGMILGTAAYMSPEQARGNRVDKRADVWAFGVVLYELLIGERLFKGKNAAETLALVVTSQPNLGKVSPQARRLLQECLQKDPKLRLRDIGYAKRLLLEDASAPVENGRSAGGHTRLVPWIAAGVLAVGFAVVSFVNFRERPLETRVVRTTILPPAGTAFDFAQSLGPLAVSPDGRRLVFTATSEDGKNQLWVQSLDALAAQPLLGTAEAKWPFWSFDSRYVAFFADGKLKKIDISGGLPITLANAPNARGGSWSPEGVIVFAPSNNGVLKKISAAGGDTSPAASPDKANGEFILKFPWFLPDGRHFLYMGQNGPITVGATIEAGSIASTEHKIVAQADSNAIYSEGRLLFLRGNTLMGQPFDLKRLATTGEPAPVAEQVQHLLTGGRYGVFSVSGGGLLAYQAGARAGNRMKLTWFDRMEKPTGTLADATVFSDIRFVPDRKSLAATVSDARGNEDIWIYDVARGLPIRFTFDPAAESDPVWSPDGRTIVFSSTRKGHVDLYRKASDGTGNEELVYTDGLNKYADSWSPDGKFLMYSTRPPTHLWILQMMGAAKPVPFMQANLQTNFIQDYGQFSPDGSWIAFRSNETHIVPFTGPGGKRQISMAGGIFPRWRPDGKEIFYLGLDGRVMAAEVTAKGNTLEVGRTRRALGIALNTSRAPYDVSADGQRILAIVQPEQKAGEPLTLIQNWTAALKK
jgi:Tol biopolymer transport system component